MQTNTTLIDAMEKYFEIQERKKYEPKPIIKITNKRTHLVFQSLEDKRKAEDFLLAMNYNFSGIVRKPVLTVAPSKYIKGYLDLYLPEHIAATTFNYRAKKH